MDERMNDGVTSRPRRRPVWVWLWCVVAIPWLVRASAASGVAPASIELDGSVVGRLANPISNEVYTIDGVAVPPQPEVKLLEASDKRGSIRPDGVVRTESICDGDSVVIRQTAERGQGGLKSVRLVVGPLDLAKVKLLIPGTGGVVIDKDSQLVSRTYHYPGHWSTPMVLVQGERGGVAIWGLDRRRPFVVLTVRKTATSLVFDLETLADPPWPRCKRFTSPGWRFQAYRGFWPAAAERYRRVMAEHFTLTKLSHRRPAWADEIRCFIRVVGPLTDGGRVHPAHREALELVASRMPAGRVMLYVPHWRVHDYDVMYPDYRPRAEAVTYVKAARAMGFRVMLHGNLVGISPFHPRIKEFEDALQLDPSNGRRVGWYLDRDVPNRIYCLNPAVPKAREMLVASYREMRNRIAFDALHLDYPVIINTQTGRVDGVNTIGGAEVYVRELAAALPGIHFATEGIFDYMLPCGFAQVGEPFWNDRRQFGQYHPIRTVLFWPYNRLYGHLGVPDQQTTLSKYLAFVDVHERTGTLPTFTINSTIGLDPALPGTSLALRQAAYWTQRLPTPDVLQMRSGVRPRWMMGGEPLFTWRLADGAAAGVVQTRNGREWIEASNAGDGVVRWGVVTGVNELKTAGHIPGWRAYDDERLFGLNPSATYLPVEGARDPSAFHLAGASKPIIVTAADAHATRDIIRVKPVTETFLDLTRTAPDRTGMVTRGQERELGSGATFSAGPTQCGGIPMQAYAAHPPWNTDAKDEAGTPLGKDALTFGEFRVSLPKGKRVAFISSIGLRDLTGELAARDSAKPLSDGVTFSVLVDGKTAFREHWAQRRWKEIRVDLYEWQGRVVTLRLQTHPGPAGHVGWDWAAWGEPRIDQTDSVAGPVKLRINQPHPVGRTMVTDRTSARILPGTATELAVALPAAVIYPRTLHAVGAGGLDLLDAPFTPFIVEGGLSQARSVWGSGTVGRYTVGDVERRGVHGHPPAFGMTRLEWLLDLPPDLLELRFSAGLLQHAEAVTFRVRVNGTLRWHSHMTHGTGWQDGRVDLSEHAGGPALLALITDSAGTNNCDWAVWGGPRLVKPGQRP